MADGREQALKTRLLLQQMFDSQFPLGGFAHSGGLEAYTADPLSPERLVRLLGNHIRLGALRLETSAMVLVYQGTDPEELALELTAWKSTPTTLHASTALGKRLVKLARRLWKVDLPVLSEQHFALQCALLGQHLQLPLEDLCLAYSQAQITSMLSACTRCMPLSPEQAQEILLDLQDTLLTEIPRRIQQPELCSAMPALDLRSHQQAFLYTRLFQS
ncbi:urease accessory protein UreF [Deinococcus cellulosilyticus]|uniref:Urease accessory protein UreF n=1 Tax=Deinococcus cellulosilyticus (strain DSM 18568 / NBRC 106333 / KACC 11606 / 5516J-15) TaxID=1223518 RepID=A0A511MXB0_DEIC1|nr:urease accessory UreF family protein [Deinococcus cellulosilyticus]GEM45001.1 urease accessory protein UreF [Deinococcus cellulosilyticus NBRC 106333 = KACC 11606]